MANKSTVRASQPGLNNDNCDSIFQIPSDLVKQYGEKLPSKVTIRVDDSGKKWKVTIEKFKDQYFFTDGWKEFAEQVGPKSLHLLKFKYGQNKKKRSDNIKVTSSIPNENKNEGTGDGTGTSRSIRDENKVNCSQVKATLSFSREMKKHHQYKLTLPKHFVLTTRIPDGGNIRLKDGEGREWLVKVKKVVRDGYLAIYGGWCNFVMDNNLMLGSTVSFTWVSENILQTEILGTGTDNIPLFSTTRNGKGKHLLDADS